MTDSDQHLTEDDRHALADGSLSPEQLRIAEAHVGICEDCAGDVARIASLVTRVRNLPQPLDSADELWPSIRSRIEHAKVVPLAAADVNVAGRVPANVGADVGSTHRARRHSLAWPAGAIGVIAAGVMIAFGLRGHSAPSAPVESPTVLQDSSIFLIAAVDSAHTYEAEAQQLLNQLELKRAMLRPEAAAAFNHDLHVVDGAIAELKTAIANEPTNRALRQLLASSYRQKVDLLKRLTNAG